MSQQDLRSRAKEFFEKYPMSEDKAGHSRAVAECAWRIAKNMKDGGVEVDPDAAYAGAILHDIGIVKSPNKTEADEQENPWPEHAVYGAKDALEAGFPVSVAAAIQNHEFGFNKSEMEELKLPPPAVGQTWGSNVIEARVVSVADQIITIMMHMGLDPWKDRDTIVRANFGYLDTLYKKRAGRGITKDHAVFKRIFELMDEILPYVKPEDVPPAWKGITTFAPSE